MTQNSYDVSCHHVFVLRHLAAKWVKIMYSFVITTSFSWPWSARDILYVNSRKIHISWAEALTFGRDSKKITPSAKISCKKWMTTYCSTPLSSGTVAWIKPKQLEVSVWPLVPLEPAHCTEWSAVSMNNRYFGLLQEYSWLVIDTSLDNFAGGRSARENANYLPDRLAEANC